MPVTYANYEEDSWDLWETTIIAHIHRMSLDDSNCFLPSPDEIEERKGMVRWLFQMEFSDELVWGVMFHDHPGIALVERLTSKHGASEAERRLRPFLA